MSLHTTAEYLIRFDVTIRVRAQNVAQARKRAREALWCKGGSGWSITGDSYAIEGHEAALVSSKKSTPVPHSSTCSPKEEA